MRTSACVIASVKRIGIRHDDRARCHRLAGLGVLPPVPQARETQHPAVHRTDETGLLAVGPCDPFIVAARRDDAAMALERVTKYGTYRRRSSSARRRSRAIASPAFSTSRESTPSASARARWCRRRQTSRSQLCRLGRCCNVCLADLLKSVGAALDATGSALVRALTLGRGG